MATGAGWEFGAQGSVWPVLGQGVHIPDIWEGEKLLDPRDHREDAGPTFVLGQDLHPCQQDRWEQELDFSVLRTLHSCGCSPELREAVSVCESRLLNLGDVPTPAVWLWASGCDVVQESHNLTEPLKLSKEIPLPEHEDLRPWLTLSPANPLWIPPGCSGADAEALQRDLLPSLLVPV